jgi:Tfp pilus assembly protein FimT
VGHTLEMPRSSAEYLTGSCELSMMQVGITVTELMAILVITAILIVIGYVHYGQ